jgi:hypothetical protein
MLEAISADEVERHGRALAVRYRKDRDRADLLVVSIAIHDVDGSPPMSGDRSSC